jgi:amino acid adenylation domain-containing protein
MVLLAAWQQLLSLRSGQEDVAVGVPIANRTCVELEPLIGFFVNLLVMRTQLAGDPSFRELLSLVKEVSLAAYEHQDAPFEQVVAALNPVRDRSRSPLFQVLFSMQNAPREELRLDDLEVELLRWGPEGTRFDLELTCIDQRGRLAGRLTYNTALFDRSTIERLRDHLVRLLELVVADPATRGSELRLMSDAEQQRLLVDWNDTAQAPVDDACIQELFDRQAQRTPDATAVEQDDQTLSFGELEARSNQVARLLAQRGVVVGALVGLCLERSPATIVAMLGVLKAGAAYVPLDPEHPSDRLSSLLQDTGARIVLTEERLAARLPAFEGELICLDRDRALIDGQEQSGLELRVRPDDPAYVLYTSGSTGEPKGVVGLHRGAVNRMRWEWSLAPWESGEKGCHKTNLGFVDSVHEIFGALCAGVPLVLIPDHKARDPRALVATLAEHGVSRLVLVPSLLAVLLEQGSDLGRQLPRLRRWTASGEALSRQLAERFAEQLPFATLWNLYGSTEVSADATLFELETTWLESDDRADVPIGRPIANVRAYVLDPSLQPLPVGVPGELHIGGSGLARGYWNRPELTSACFVADPFGDESGGRLYKTGDRARYLDDGTLEYLGRIDSQVKIRGQRVEPGEIESVLHEHPRVQRAVVVAREDRPGDQRLVAYVVLQSGSADAPEVQGQLVSALRQRLPAHMLPSACVLLEAFPLLPSGKLDREALPLPVLERGPAGFVGPRCETENILCAIWTELLGVERVGVHDDFFALGGHSLLAARSVNRIHDKWAGLALSLRSVFEHPTVAGLAASIDALLSPGDTEDAVPGARSVAEEPALARRARSGESPLSFAQQRLWFLDRLGAGSAYNMPVAYRLKGGLDLGSLQRAVLELVRRHEVLRTGIVLVDGVPVQRIAEQVPLDIGLVDLSELESAAREAEIERLAREHALRPFDLSRPPLCRVSVLDCGNDERVLLLTLHHVVSDGWSMELVSTELSLLYEAFTRGAPSPLPDLAFQYADFACWQRERLQGAELERQLTYWRRQLSGLTALQLPVDHPRPAVQGYESASFDFALPGELCEQLRQLARNEGVTLSMLLLAAWQVLLSKSCGTHDVAVGSPIANRTRVELEPLIGFFVNTLVLRGDLSAQQSFAGDLLPRIKECVLAASEHQELPFEKLVEELDPQRDASRHPLFQVAFMLADAPRQTLHLGDLEIERLRLQTAQTGLDLDLRVHDFGDQLGCRLLYDAELFEPTTIERLSGHFSQLLAAIVRDPHARLTELSLMGEQERQLLLETCCRASALGAPDAGLPLVHREFEACAAQRPDATALVHGKRELTYAELNARANQVAHLLRSKGVGPDRIVGLCMQRSPELLIGLLGILKAGGAYLPLDPTLPRERLGLMLGETGVRLLLTLASSQDRLPEHGAEIFCLDREQLALDGAATDDPTWSVAPTDLANAIYTSGSTGLPKAVLVEHAGLSCVSREQLRAFDVGPGTRVLQFASVGFDASLFEIIMALAHGGTLILGDADELLPGPELLAFLRRHAIEVVTLPATALAMLPHEELPDLKILTVAGEACSAELVDRWAPGRRFFNLYGLTETSIWSTMAELSPGDRPHIGRPIGDVCVYPLDPHGRLTPIGVVGDIHLGGTGIARGYRGRARLTAERFVPDPFSPIAGARLYRTGDLARFRHDGCLEFIGRADSQIKLRGQRIEPREIEAALSALPGVEQAVVVPRGEDLDRRLVAYLVGSGGGVPAQRELREALGRILPTYMLPADYEVLTELPRNSSGKIDRAALPEPTRQGIDSNTREPPETATEKVVASIWSELLETRAVGRHDHFIDLGGHSLLAVTVLERMQEELGVKIPPRDLLFGTLLQVAAACDAILANPPRRGSWFSRLVSRLIRRRHRRERAG